MNENDTQRIREIKEREAKASRGPWQEIGAMGSFESHFVWGEKGPGYGSITEVLSPGLIYNNTQWDEGIANRSFIAHARADIPWLLEQLGKAISERDAATKEATEQACKDVCELCARGLKPTRSEQILAWSHADHGFAACKAGAIYERSRVAAQEKKA